MKTNSLGLVLQADKVAVIFQKSYRRCIWVADARFISALCFSILILCADGCKKKPVPAPPSEVQFITLAATNVLIFEEWIGTLDGYVNAQIRAQVPGYLLTQNYAEGSEVKAGDVLFQIDPRPLQAELNQTLAKLAMDKAQAGKTGLDVKRFTPLAKAQAISQEQLACSYGTRRETLHAARERTGHQSGATGQCRAGEPGSGCPGKSGRSRR